MLMKKSDYRHTFLSLCVTTIIGRAWAKKIPQV